ncbi:TlpA disulfide reductase family protein [Aestuariibaculum sp. YM273]|uniref:TlpA family protein disulfide reductase n=1 Tax=Aestuariibaculum sp. YM273 TaxID=3070659 RepID=UPI0027DB003C|nr:TlpA disulfide reductase family protein [Aestuariibaculum sp. YM273]WMI64143.1 TlpA disulfide reductase family protein [Aestuariibaculum sp. YM273]
MNRSIITVIGAWLVCFAAIAQKTNATFSVFPENPKAGEEITLRYNSANTHLKNVEQVSAVIYLFNDFKWEAKDITLNQDSLNIWKTRVKLSDKSAFISCVFKSDTLIDKGERWPYSWILGDSPGAYLAWGTLRNKAVTELPEAVPDNGFIADSISFFWVKNELKYHPQSRGRVFYQGLKLLTLSKRGDHKSSIKNELRYILTLNLDNKQQYQVQKALNLLPQDEEKVFVDSVKTALLKSYPKGVLARDQQILSLFREIDANKKMQLFNEFQKQFPQKRFNDVYTETEELYYDKLFKSVAYQYIVQNNDYSYAFNNLNETPYNVLLDYAWHFVSIPLSRETEDIESLKTKADVIITELERRETIIPKQFQGHLSALEWKNRAIEYSAREYLSYAVISEKAKDYINAKKFLEKVKPLMAYKNTEFNDLNVRLLIGDNQHNQAISFIEACIKENNATPAMLRILQEDFEKQNYSMSFDAYVSDLKSKGLAFEEHKAKVISELINKPIEGFKLESSKGGKVKLSKQKGKIVVIDMWATWCAPCKKAMPGMQLAVNKYADDRNVKFFFLDTQEFDKNYKTKVAKFVEEKGYDFEVLFDTENPKTGKLDDTYSKYAEAFKFSGIPQKMIIDAKGNLRWRSTGYLGSPSELADEISIVIEYLKNEK